MSLPISVFIICYNEIERMEIVLQSVSKLSTDIVVVDSGSTDGSVELAKKYTDRVFYREWTGFGEQKVFAESLCRYNWVLNLDADEVLSEELLERISKIVIADPSNTKRASGFELRVTMMTGLQDKKKVRILAPFNYTGRFYDKRYAGFSDSSVHDKLTDKLSGSVRFPRLKGYIYHYSIKNYHHMWCKIGDYSKLQADVWVKKGRKPRVWMAFFEGPLFFLKHYFARRLFALGSQGFVIALSLTAGRVLRRVIAHEIYSKRINLKNQKDE